MPESHAAMQHTARQPATPDTPQANHSGRRRQDGQGLSKASESQGQHFLLDN